MMLLLTSSYKQNKNYYYFRKFKKKSASCISSEYSDIYVALLFSNAKIEHRSQYAMLCTYYF